MSRLRTHSVGRVPSELEVRLAAAKDSQVSKASLISLDKHRVVLAAKVHLATFSMSLRKCSVVKRVVDEDRRPRPRDKTS